MENRLIRWQHFGYCAQGASLAKWVAEWVLAVELKALAVWRDSTGTRGASLITRGFFLISEPVVDQGLSLLLKCLLLLTGVTLRGCKSCLSTQSRLRLLCKVGRLAHRHMLSAIERDRLQVREFFAQPPRSLKVALIEACEALFTCWLAT